MHLEIDRQSDLERLEAIRAELERALGDVRAAVEDWRPILAKIDAGARAISSTAPRRSTPRTSRRRRRSCAWIADHHFIFLGYGCYDLVRDKGGDQLRRVEGSALGLLRRQAPAAPTSRSFAALPPESRRQAREPVPLVITKANARSTVHRPVYLDYIGVKRFDAKGKVVGEHRFLGLFTSAAYNRNPRPDPAAPPQGRAGDRARRPAADRPLGQGAGQHPRDLSARRAVPDRRGRAVRDRPGDPAPAGAPEDPAVPAPRPVRPLRLVPGLRAARALQHRDPARASRTSCRRRSDGTEVEFQAQVSESVLARIQFIVRTPEGIPAEVDPAERSRRRLVEAARSWNDGLREALIDAHGEEEGNRLFAAYGEAFPLGYREHVPARAAVPDIDRIDQLARGATDLAMSLYRPLEHDERRCCASSSSARARRSLCPTSCRCSRTWVSG